MESTIINNEECRVIKGYERYYISESGQIYRYVPLNLKEKALMNSGAQYVSKNKLHYREVNGKLRQAFCSITTSEGRLCNVAAAPLVAIAFEVDPKGFNPKKKSIEYIDGNKRNLHYTNFKVVEKRSSNSKLSKSDVKKIRRLFELNIPLKHIGDTFGVSEMQINRIKTGENWGNGKRKIKAPVAPFDIEDGKIRKYIAIFNREEAPKEIKREFTVKRNPKEPTDNLIIGILKGYKLSLKHKNITRALVNAQKLNDYFF